MLAVMGQPFDSDDHFFEIKWDGFRAIALIEGGGVRLMSRNGKDLGPRFPELEGLAGLPRGTVLDGEIVILRDGKPDFESVIGRRGKSGPPATYVAFDLIFRDYEPLSALPFTERRGQLEDVLGGPPRSFLALSQGMRGGGTTFYQAACRQGLEGVVAKRLSSPYAAGKRNGAWVKIKRRLQIQVAVIGFIAKGDNDFQSILVAASGLSRDDGKLRYVGNVGSGFTEAERSRMNALLRERLRPTPIVACPERGTWTEPGLYCMVSYAELTEAGRLRAPVFEELIEA
jgi:DNA ligase D-like protein (predicted ligase)